MSDDQPQDDRCQHGVGMGDCALCQADDEIASLRTALAQAEKERDEAREQLETCINGRREYAEALRDRCDKAEKGRDEAREEMHGLAGACQLAHRETAVSRAEVERLRGALERIVDVAHNLDDCNVQANIHTDYCVAKLARAALKKGTP